MMCPTVGLFGVWAGAAGGLPCEETTLGATVEKTRRRVDGSDGPALAGGEVAVVRMPRGGNS